QRGARDPPAIRPACTAVLSINSGGVGADQPSEVGQVAGDQGNHAGRGERDRSCGQRDQRSQQQRAGDRDIGRVHRVAPPVAGAVVAVGPLVVMDVPVGGGGSSAETRCTTGSRSSRSRAVRYTAATRWRRSSTMVEGTVLRGKPLSASRER